MPLFSGEYPSTIDDKNRIIVPAKLRQAAGRDGEAGYMVTRGLDNCICIQTAARFEDSSVGRIDARMRRTRAGRKMERAIFSKAEPARCDKQGRLLLPLKLIQQLNIGKEIVIVGVIDRVEVWDRAAWEKEDLENQRQLEERTEEVYGGPGEA